MRKRKSSFLEDLGELFVAAPWWVGPIVVVGVYVLMRYLMPPFLQSMFPAGSNPTTATMNKTFVQIIGPLPAMLAPWIAGLFLFVWLGSLFQKGYRRGLLNKTQNSEHVDSLSWQDFELLVAEFYRRRGFMVQERGGASPDGGIDIVLRKGSSTILVQCKHWKAFKVGVSQVRELLGVMTHEGANGGVLVTSGHFSQDASDFAKKNGIELVNGAALIESVRSVQSAGPQKPADSSLTRPKPAVRPLENSAIPSCPRCGSPMVLQTAKKGPNSGSQFYGCKRFPDCRGTRNIGSE